MSTFVFPIGLQKVGTSWISRKGGILERGWGWGGWGGGWGMNPLINYDYSDNNLNVNITSLIKLIIQVEGNSCIEISTATTEKPCERKYFGIKKKVRNHGNKAQIFQPSSKS